MNSNEKLPNPASTPSSSSTTNESAERVCRKHNIPLAFQEYAADITISRGRWYCPLCEADNDRIASDREAAELRASLINGIPPRYHSAALKQFDAAIIKHVLRWVENPNGFIYVQGSCGIGKTHLSCAVKKALNVAGKNSLLVFASEMFRELYEKKSYINKSSEIATFNRYADVDVAIFDDVGASDNNAVNVWYDIIDRRYSWDRPTMYTSNLNFEELKAVLGDRTASRILSGIKIKMEGTDRRLKEHWTACYD